MRPHATPYRPAPWWVGALGLAAYLIVAVVVVAAIWAGLALVFSMGEYIRTVTP